MHLCHRLRDAAQPHWDAAIHHRFVDELIEGRIDDAVFARYLVQDYCFCDSFVRLMGAAVCAADDADARLVHARQLAVVAGDEHRYFLDAFAALGVEEREWRSPELAGPTREFIDLMDEACASQDYAVILVVLVVAEWLYLEWASRATAPLPPRPEHHGWIRIHADAEFVRWVDFLRGELERVGAGREFECLSTPFIRASRIEERFFDMAYDQARD